MRRREAPGATVFVRDYRGAGGGAWPRCKARPSERGGIAGAMPHKRTREQRSRWAAIARLRWSSLALAAFGARAESYDPRRLRAMRARATFVHQPVVLHAQERIAHAVRIDAERLTDVVEGERPVPIQRAYPALRLPRQHARPRARRPKILLEAADRVLEDGEHERLLGREVAVASRAVEELLRQDDVRSEDVAQTVAYREAPCCVAGILGQRLE